MFSCHSTFNLVVLPECEIPLPFCNTSWPRWKFHFVAFPPELRSFVPHRHGRRPVCSCGGAGNNVMGWLLVVFLEEYWKKLGRRGLSTHMEVLPWSFRNSLIYSIDNLFCLHSRLPGRFCTGGPHGNLLCCWFYDVRVF